MACVYKVTTGVEMILRFAFLAIMFTIPSACDILLHEVGDEGEPCLKNEKCNTEGLICYQGSCCKPSCEGKVCGDFGCGISCGTCSGATEYCTDEGQCEDDCAERVCGPSPNASHDCGYCEPNEECNGSGQCDCPNEICEGICCAKGEICDEGSCEDNIALTWRNFSGGSFMMGSNSESLKEKPVHQVTVPYFEMTLTEVTVAQYEACVIGGACSNPNADNDCNWNVTGREEHPVNCVDWYQAVSFCEWVGGRLPSEAEWEYAARSGGQDITYPWGNESPTCDYCVMDDGGSGCGQNRTWAVCSKHAGNTEQGLCDMAGNVWEWVQDWFHSTYDGAPTDGSAWEDPAGSEPVLRGGSWFNSNDYYLRASRRSSNPPHSRGNYQGFRCARDQ